MNFLTPDALVLVEWGEKFKSIRKKATGEIIDCIGGWRRAEDFGDSEGIAEAKIKQENCGMIDRRWKDAADFAEVESSVRFLSQRCCALSRQAMHRRCKPRNRPL